jgi:hypothetical protein
MAALTVDQHAIPAIAPQIFIAVDPHQNRAAPIACMLICPMVNTCTPLRVMLMPAPSDPASKPAPITPSFTADVVP